MRYLCFLFVVPCMSLILRRQLASDIMLQVEMANGTAYARLSLRAPGCTYLNDTALVAFGDDTPSPAPNCTNPGCGPVRCEPAYSGDNLTLYIQLPRPPQPPPTNFSVYVLLLGPGGQVGRVYARAPAAVARVHCLDVCY